MRNFTKTREELRKETAWWNIFRLTFAIPEYRATASGQSEY